MIKGKRLYLRTFKQGDVEPWLDAVNNLDYRGEHLPLGLSNRVDIQKQFQEHGLWTEDYGRMLILENQTDRMLGYVVYFKTAHYMSGPEIGYVIFDPADRQKGYCSEAVRILTNWLFLSKTIERIQITMDADHHGSRRVAEKCGYTYEGTMRRAAYSRGKYHDILLFSMIRPEFEEGALR